MTVQVGMAENFRNVGSEEVSIRKRAETMLWNVTGPWCICICMWCITEAPTYIHLVHYYSYGWLSLTDQWLKCLQIIKGVEISMHSFCIDSAYFFASSFINLLLFQTSVLMRAQQHKPSSPSDIKDRQY